MRLLSKEIYEVLELKFSYHCKVGTGISGYNEDVTHRIYSFEKNNNSYKAIYNEQKNGSATYYIEKNGTTINDIDEAKEILILAKKIFVPTDPALKQAISDMSKIAIAKSLEKQYPSEDQKDI